MVLTASSVAASQACTACETRSRKFKATFHMRPIISIEILLGLDEAVSGHILNLIQKKFMVPGALDTS